MKQYNIIILLSFLFFPAFVHADFLRVQPAGTTVSVSVKSSTCFTTGLNYPGSEIERCTIHSYTGLVNKVPQKIPGYLSDTKGPAIAALSSPPVVFSAIELFNNNYLSHNYPSHNFW